ncbi:unnamed protein product, partial [Eruca vesicaria subsp. sativa]|nr:unnamed protein product [Eruca vesicaria subsp. sativa]
MPTGMQMVPMLLPDGRVGYVLWHHHNDPQELTGITAQAEGQGERAAMIMMATEEAE